MKKTIKKPFFALFSFFLILLVFTSCIDYTQSVTKKGSVYSLYFKLTVSKALLSMSGEEGSEAMRDFDDSLKGLMGEDFPPDCSINKIDNENEYGAEVFIKINEKTKDAQELALLPKRTKRGLEVPFFAGDSEDITKNMASNPTQTPDEAMLDIEAAADKATDEVTKAILDQYVWTLLVGKSVAPKVKNAYFAGPKGKTLNLPVKELGDNWEVSIPLSAVDSKSLKLDTVIIEEK